MKAHLVKWQFIPLSDTTKCETPQMPGVTRSSNFVNDISNLQPSPSAKMPAANLLRLNSVGEVSAESFPETAARKGKLGFSKSLDSISSGNRFSSGSLGLDANHNIMRSASVTGQMTGLKGENRYFSNSPLAPPHPHYNHLSQRPPFPFWQSSSSFPIGMYQPLPQSWNQFVPQRPGLNLNINRSQFIPSHIFPGLFQGSIFSAMSALPPNCVRQMPVPDNSFYHSKPTSQSQNAHYTGFKSTKLFSEQAKGKMNGSCLNGTGHVNKAKDMKPTSAPKDASSSNIIEKDKEESGNNHSTVIDLRPNDNESSILQTPNKNEVIAIKSIQSEHSLKRRNERDTAEETLGSSDSNSKCSLANVIDVLSLRKTPKKGRPSCKKRKRRQNQRSNPKLGTNCQNKNLDIVDRPIQSDHASQPKSQSAPETFVNLETHRNHNNRSLPSNLNSHPSCVAKLFCSPVTYSDSDSELSDIEDEDNDDCDSKKLSCEYPDSLSSLCDLGSALSLDALFQPQSLPNLKPKKDCESRTCHSKQKRELESPSQSPSLKKPVRFSFSFTVSDDEESDKSFDSFSSSPSEQFFLDFEFGTGLSLEAFIGKKANAVAPESPNDQCPDDKKHSPSEQDSRLMQINAKWNESYPSLEHWSPAASCDKVKAKVQFAVNEDLAQVYVVSNENRRGTWAEDGQRFQKHIKETGIVLAHIFTEDHRQKIRLKLGL